METVEIDRSGTFKYVLLRLQSLKSTGSSRLLVRGSQQAGYHRDVVQMAQQACAVGEGQVSMASSAADPLPLEILADVPATIGLPYTTHRAYANQGVPQDGLLRVSFFNLSMHDFLKSGR